MTAQRARPFNQNHPRRNDPSDRFQVDIGHADPETVVVQLFGEIDHSTQPMLVTALEHVLDGWPQHVIIGLAHVDFIGSHGVRALCSAHLTAVERGIGFTLTAPPLMVARVLAITGVDRIMPVHPTMHQALTNA